MTSLLYFAVLLICPIGMGLMMWMMMRGDKPDVETRVAGSPDEISQLRAEVDQLRAAQRDNDSAVAITNSASIGQLPKP